jgi:hypothetical protein
MLGKAVQGTIQVFEIGLAAKEAQVKRGRIRKGPSQNEAALESLPNESGELTNTDWDAETNGGHDEIQAMMIVGFKIISLNSQGRENRETLYGCMGDSQAQ